MATGRDLAKFISQQTGQNYVALYDESEAEENRMMEQKQKFQKSFNSMMTRLNENDKRNKKDMID